MVNPISILIEELRREYDKRIDEALKATVGGDNILSPGLKVKTRKNDKKREVPKGTLYTIKSVSTDSVTLHRDSAEGGKRDAYAASDIVVSYRDLEKMYELD